MYLATDPNDSRMITYKEVQRLCGEHDVEFCNQSFGNFVKELRADFFDEKSRRVLFSKEERIQTPGIYFCESHDYFPMRGNG